MANTNSNKRILKAWLGFEEKTVNPMAGTEQREDMKNAFFAGAYSMFLLEMELIDEDDPENEISRVHKELVAHF